MANIALTKSNPKNLKMELKETKRGRAAKKGTANARAPETFTFDTTGRTLPISKIKEKAEINEKIEFFSKKGRADVFTWEEIDGNFWNVAFIDALKLYYKLNYLYPSFLAQSLFRFEDDSPKSNIEGADYLRLIQNAQIWNECIFQKAAAKEIMRNAPKKSRLLSKDKQKWSELKKYINSEIYENITNKKEKMRVLGPDSQNQIFASYLPDVLGVLAERGKPDFLTPYLQSAEIEWRKIEAEKFAYWNSMANAWGKIIKEKE